MNLTNTRQWTCSCIRIPPNSQEQNSLNATGRFVSARSIHPTGIVPALSFNPSRVPIVQAFSTSQSGHQSHTPSVSVTRLSNATSVSSLCLMDPSLSKEVLVPKSKTSYNRKMKKRKKHTKLVKWAERKVAQMEDMTVEQRAERWGILTRKPKEPDAAE